jgi:hypothetical protein
MPPDVQLAGRAVNHITGAVAAPFPIVVRHQAQTGGSDVLAGQLASQCVDPAFPPKEESVLTEFGLASPRCATTRPGWTMPSVCARIATNPQLSNGASKAAVPAAAAHDHRGGRAICEPRRPDGRSGRTSTVRQRSGRPRKHRASSRARRDAPAIGRRGRPSWQRAGLLRSRGASGHLDLGAASSLPEATSTTIASSGCLERTRWASGCWSRVETRP